jgi:hypothetical protein
MKSAFASFGGSENKPAWYTPPIWLGMTLSGWIRMLVHNRFSVDVRHIPWTVLITLTALLGAPINFLHDLRWAHRIRRTQIERPPLFVIGHWRSGTTWLHELLTLDESHTYPNTYQCFLPSRFLLTEHFHTHGLSLLFDAMLPKKRPFDNVEVGWTRPQEDEFALCNMGIPSPYQKIAFPRHDPYPEYFDLLDIPPQQLKRWEEAFVRFLKQLTIRDPRRIVLKSPTHTFRVGTLLKIFPDAQFVHIVRDPYVTFYSTLRMWKSLYQATGLQQLRDTDDLETYVFRNFIRMHERLEEARPHFGSSSFHELRYEDLVRDPIGQLRLLYEQLQLGDIELVVPNLVRYLAGSADYKTNKYQVSDELRKKIRQHWGKVIDKYDY